MEHPRRSRRLVFLLFIGALVTLVWLSAADSRVLRQTQTLPDGSTLSLLGATMSAPKGVGGGG